MTAGVEFIFYDNKATIIHMHSSIQEVFMIFAYVKLISISPYIGY